MTASDVSEGLLTQMNLAKVTIIFVMLTAAVCQADTAFSQSSQQSVVVSSAAPIESDLRNADDRLVVDFSELSSAFVDNPAEAMERYGRRPISFQVIFRGTDSSPGNYIVYTARGRRLRPNEIDAIGRGELLDAPRARIRLQDRDAFYGHMGGSRVWVDCEYIHIHHGIPHLVDCWARP